MRKFSVYVDETGQDTQGKFFLVGVVITEVADEFGTILNSIEKDSGKHRLKWHKANQNNRENYIRAVFKKIALMGILYYQVHQDTLDYAECVVQTIVEAINHIRAMDYEAIVTIDGLNKVERNKVASALRQKGIRPKKIRGARDETEVLLRLADALCGFVRDSMEGWQEYRYLLEKAERDGYVVALKKH